MEYTIEFKPKLIKDLDSLQPDVVKRIIEKISRLSQDLEGDVKRLTHFTPEYPVAGWGLSCAFRGERKAGSRVSCPASTGSLPLGNDMIELHPEILTKNGRKEFAVLPYEEFLAITEALTDYEDLQDLRAAKAGEGSAATISLKEAAKRYGVG